MKAALCLVGPNQQENLGLQYLAASAERAGYPTGSWDSPGATICRAWSARCWRRIPLLVGLGMAFQYSVNDYLELAGALRDQGYRGHLTAGGHVPTFCWRDLLTSCPSLDSVVLHEGEHTVVELLARLEQGRTVVGIPGSAWREAEGPVLGPPRRPVEDLDALAPPKRGAAPYLVAGIPVAFLLTARGCIGECAYCCIRAFARSAGGPRLRLRSADAVGREIAELGRRGVRIVFVQDDLFVLPDERRAVVRLEQIQRACERHGASPMCWWVKGRPESVTPAVLACRRQARGHALVLWASRIRWPNGSPTSVGCIGPNTTDGPSSSVAARASTPPSISCSSTRNRRWSTWQSAWISRPNTSRFPGTCVARRYTRAPICSPGYPARGDSRGISGVGATGWSTRARSSPSAFCECVCTSERFPTKAC